MKRSLTSFGLIGIAAVVGWFILGSGGALAAGTGGLVATVVQLAARRLMDGQREAAFTRFAARWAMGSGLRIGGVLVVVVLVLIDRTLFAPLPTALGFLGVLIPLLALDTHAVQ